MTIAHTGSSIGVRGYLIPVDYQDKLFSYVWNPVSGRGDQPTTNISTFVPDTKFNQVIAIEDPTTNLLDSNSADFENGSIGNWKVFGPGGGSPSSLTIDNTYSLSGSNSLKAVVGSGTSGSSYIEMGDINGGGAGATGVVVSPNTTYAVSAYVYIQNQLSSPLQFYIGQGDGTNYYGGLDSSLMSITGPTNGWSRLSGTVTTASGTTRLTIRMGTRDITNAYTFWVDAVQVEQKSYVTSFVNGSRNTGQLIYPATMFPTGDFTVNMWITPTAIQSTLFGQNYKLFALGSDYTASRLTVWNYCPTTSDSLNRRIISDYGNDASGTRQYKDLDDPNLFVPGTWEMFTVTFNYASNFYSFYRNGALWATFSPSKINSISQVMLSNGGWKYSNLLICPRVVPALEIETWYNNRQPFYDPYNYLAIYG